MTPPLPNLVLFDLDNTLLAGDSDYEWGVFLCNEGAVEADDYRRRNQAFYEDYQAGRLDALAYVHFVLEAITATPPDKLTALHARFMAEHVEPMVTQSALELVKKHQRAGDLTAIITATNRFITEPIAARFGVRHLIATEPERDGNDRYTGRIEGVPCFREGKIECLKRWLERERPTYGETWFYSDSHNDLPLLEQVDRPVVVDGDEALVRRAKEKRWEITSLRGEA